MRLAYCLRCGDAFKINNVIRQCTCGNVEAVQASSGDAELTCIDIGRARVIALSDDMLAMAQAPVHPADSTFVRNANWRNAHERLVNSSMGRIYHLSARACWAAILRPDEVKDVRFRSVDDPTVVAAVESRGAEFTAAPVPAQPPVSRPSQPRRGRVSSARLPGHRPPPRG